MSNDLSSSLEALFGKMENFVSTKTVVGEPVHINDLILIPLVDVSFGMAAGAYEKSAETHDSNDMGAGGLGAKITPSAVLVVINGTVQLVNVKNQDSLNKLIDMAPGVLSKLNLPNLFNKSKEKPGHEEKPDETKPVPEIIIEP